MRDRRAPLFAAVGVAAVVLLAIFFLVLPKMSQVSSAQDQLTQAETQEATLRSQLAALQQAQQDAPVARETIRQVDTAIPPTMDQQGFILLLQNAADQAGIDLFTITPGTPLADPATGLTSSANSITVNGSYFAITEFMFNIETLPRAATISNLQVTPAGEGGGLTGVATVTIFTTDQSAGPGSAPGPTTSAGGVTAPAVSPAVSPSPEGT